MTLPSEVVERPQRSLHTEHCSVEAHTPHSTPTFHGYQTMRHVLLTIILSLDCPRSKGKDRFSF